MKSHIHRRPVFEKLLFSQSWEDPELDITALRIGSNDRVLVVTSGGCNALSLLTRGPKELIAIDMNPLQSWLLELKLAGIRALSHEEFLQLLGVKFIEEPNPKAIEPAVLYGRARRLLSAGARDFWDYNLHLVDQGVLQVGRYESYLAMFRRVLRFLVGGGTLRDLMRQQFATQEEFYRKRWDRFAWRLFIRMFFSRRVLGKYGLDSEFFKYVKDVPSFGEHWLRLTKHALTELPVRQNYFLAQIAFGKYLNREAVPRYLHERYFNDLKRYVDRVRVVTQELEGFLLGSQSGSIDKFALSNVFEWVDEATYQGLLQEIWRVASPDARICYRNLLVRRERPESLAHRLRSHSEEAQRLHWHDRSFVYSNFVIEEIIKTQTCIENDAPSGHQAPANHDSERRRAGSSTRWTLGHRLGKKEKNFERREIDIP
jgi:S-adenosylmethionine-diacylglycerol 3-amino-3-carboxypropyl transferase